jgi:hypothetical protein
MRLQELYTEGVASSWRNRWAEIIDQTIRSKFSAGNIQVAGPVKDLGHRNKAHQIQYSFNCNGVSYSVTFTSHDDDGITATIASPQGVLGTVQLYPSIIPQEVEHVVRTEISKAAQEQQAHPEPQRPRLQHTINRDIRQRQIAAVA